MILSRQLSFLALIYIFFLSSYSYSSAMPEELYNGMVKYALESGNYFDALVLMDEEYKSSHAVEYASGLQGFNINSDVSALLKSAKKTKINNENYFAIGKIEYRAENCKAALRAFKRLKNKLSLEDKQQWAFYRSNCFIKLGSNSRSAKVLSDMLGGIWASYAYYNLAMSYAELSRNKTKALVVLRIAASFLKNKTKEEKSLSDRINLAAGALYQEAKQSEKAIPFFKKVYLDSESAPKALYLNGLALLELGEFRLAVQTWYSAKNYPLLYQSVDESLLAIPYAFERSGYTSQALEAYLKASAEFEDELNVINKVDGLLKKYGVQKILIEETEIDGLEWFLARDVVTNTTRASYYRYFVQDTVIYDQIELQTELGMLAESLKFWSSQLVVFDHSLKGKRKNFKQRSDHFDAKSVERKILHYGEKISDLQNKNKLPPALVKNLQIQKMIHSVNTLQSRFLSLKDKIKKGRGKLKAQLKQSADLKLKIHQSRGALLTLSQSLDKEITSLVRHRLGLLRTKMLSNFERAEQGLVHIFESIAESNYLPKKNKTVRRNQ